ncbi:integral membrane export protein [Streptomyces bingchenggensis BCW-1]|uniref:Integral membrane export protein n=1 Tax=Streptomyces bingchenggensis (strain BCW-1) TaxID=749414 RepID=D7BZ98_STRBB|nr:MULTISPECIES: MMPL family transporter [Streptomyces]ADI07834.1 integral membrane export protein [Streptomyces bingchenggensis BCW-1]
MAAWARWCLRHRLVVLLLWVGALFGTAVASGVAGSAYANVFGFPGTESSRAMERMEKAFPQRAGDTDSVVWEVDQGKSVKDPAVRERMSAALADIGKLPEVGTVVSPYEPEGARQISENGRIAYAEVTFTKQAFELRKENIQKVVDRAEEARTAGLRVELGGQAIEQTQEPPAGLSEAVGIVAAAVVLFLAFGSLFAMLLPLLNAVFAVGTGLSALVLLSHVVDLPDVAPLMGSLIGLGVGIDYALFIVTRHRKGLRAGLDPAESATRALDTSGRAVLFAGGTVCIALLAMFSLDLSFLNGIAIAATLTTLLSVAAAVTLLPAMFGFLGHRVLSRRERRALAEEGPREGEKPGGRAVRWASFVERRPKALAAVALVVMAVLAIPTLSLRLGTNDQGNQPESQTTRKAYDLLAEGFGPGFNGPLLMVADVSGGAAEQRALDGLVRRVNATEGVVRAVRLPAGPGVAKDTAVVQVVPTTSPQSEKTDRLIDTLRDDIVPAAERGTALEVDIGGATAIQKDFASVIGERLPPFIALIVGLGALLLLVAFRSVVVPLTAAVMNLIAAAASFGVLVAVFQWGWGMDLLGLGKEGPIISFLPVIMLPLLFGLSMDYQVFLVSRMHEEWVHTKDNARAVRAGLADTSRVINCAALIMICVFSSFILSGDRGGVMAGLGLAGSVALDAFILRMVLVPALMQLIGRANWWLPRAIDKRLPHLAVDPPDRPYPGVSPEPEGERELVGDR